MIFCKNTSVFTKIKYLSFSFLLIFGGAFFTALLTYILEVNDLIQHYKNLAVPSLQKSYGVYAVYIITVLIAPIIEELAFRTLLVFSKLNLTVSAALLSYLLISLFVGGGYLLNIATVYKVSGGLLTALLISAALNKDTIYIKVKSMWEDYYPFIFYTSAVGFAYLHLPNFGEIDLEKLLFSPIIVLPFFVYAIIFGFVRVRFGLKWAIILHIILNSFARVIKTI